MTRSHALASLIVAAVLAVAQGHASAASPLTYLESGGVVTGEAEMFTSRLSSALSQWKLDSEITAGDNAVAIANARGGGYVQVLPDTTGGSNNPQDPPEITYRMKIDTVGTYRLWLRWDGDTPTGNADSMFANIEELNDGVGGTIADWYELVQGIDQNFATSPWDGSGGFEKNEGGPPEVSMLWDIAAPGYYTLRLSQREDGAAVDAFVLQLSTLGAPTGIGPATSELEAIPEPVTASLGVIGLGALGLAMRRRRTA